MIKLNYLSNLLLIARRFCMMSSSLCECFVRSVKSEDQLAISFKYLIDSDERQFNLKRNKDEEVGRVFARITQNINNCIKKKNKKNKVQQTSTNELSPDDVTLRINDEIVENDIVNREAWKEGNLIMIIIFLKGYFQVQL